ncbi:MAG: Hsp33 family molecular chaperone HslO [Mariprofundus sp.]|nr:Hsp33 family molecular chaperone HslO [Mariprofundus sp.]
MAQKDPLSPVPDTLIRFLLPAAYTRGVIIRGSHIVADGMRIHRLSAEQGVVFGQTLLASLLLLSINKGGMRQVLQLDTLATDATPVQRMLAESRLGSVRGYVNSHPLIQPQLDQPATTIGAWMGQKLRLSTVRDLGFGNPYISSVEHQSPFLADHLISYLSQSVQIRADIILHGDLAILIEAMPGCGEEQWFKAVECLAKIPTATLSQESPEQILSFFHTLQCKQVSRDHYAYQCNCNPEQMAAAISTMNKDQLHELVDASGQITVTCQYCGNHYSVPHRVDPKLLQ